MANIIGHYRKCHNVPYCSQFVPPKFCKIIVFSFSWGHFNSQEKLKTMLTQKFGLTIKEHYGMLRYFLEWSICQSHGPSLYRGSIVILRLQPVYKAALLAINAIQFFFRRIFTQKRVPREGNAFVLDKQHDCHDARCTASSKTLLKTAYNHRHFAK